VQLADVRLVSILFVSLTTKTTSHATSRFSKQEWMVLVSPLNRNLLIRSTVSSVLRLFVCLFVVLNRDFRRPIGSLLLLLRGAVGGRLMSFKSLPLPSRPDATTLSGMGLTDEQIERAYGKTTKTTNSDKSSNSNDEQDMHKLEQVFGSLSFTKASSSNNTSSSSSSPTSTSTPQFDFTSFAARGGDSNNGRRRRRGARNAQPTSTIQFTIAQPKK
jgi:hypothetical protein